MDLIVYVCFRALEVVCRLLGRRGSVALGYLVGLAIQASEGHRHLRIWVHMRRPVGPERARSLLRKYYEHLGLLAIEYARLHLFRPERVEEYVEVEGLDILKKAIELGKGVAVLTGHYGNWEILGQVLVAHGVPLHVPYKAPANKYLDRHLRSLRNRKGIEVIEKAGASKKSIRVLRAGEVVGLILDQDAGDQGIFVPFFGELASTIPTAAVLARHMDMPILPVVCNRLRSRRHYRVSIRDPIEVAHSDDKKRDVLVTTGLCSLAMEDAIMRFPGQWLWAQRRWRTRPRPEDVTAWQELGNEGVPTRRWPATARGGTEAPA